MISNITHTPPSAAEVRQTLTYTPERGLDRGLIFAAPQPMLWGAYSSILGEGILTTYKCSSGNCTFPALQTIGLCSTCQETTASLNRNCKQLTPRAPFCRSTNDCLTSGQLCTYSSPTHNTTAGGGTTYLSLNSTGRSFQPNQGENTITINHDLVEISVVYIQPTGSANDPRAPAVPGYIPTNGSHVAQSYVCRLSYCEKTIKTTIALGQLYEEISVFDPSSTPPLTMPAITDISQITDQLFSTQLKLSEKTKISVAAVFALAQGFSRALTGKSEVATSLFPEAGEVSEFHRAMYQLLLSTPFPGMIQRITNSVTNALRIEGDIVKGDTYWHFMVVKIEYRWFAYPAICWFFVFVLVMGSSLFEFAKKRVWWGTSMLPAVMVGMPETVREELVLEHKASLGDKSEMRKKGEKVKMRIVKVDDEGELEWSMNGGREAGIFGAAFGRT